MAHSPQDDRSRGAARLVAAALVVLVTVSFRISPAAGEAAGELGAVAGIGHVATMPATGSPPAIAAEQSACGKAYGLVAGFGAAPDTQHYRAVLAGVPPLFGRMSGPVGAAGRTLAADWQRYSAAFFAGGGLSEHDAHVIVGDILALANACAAAGQPVWPI